MLLMYWSKTGWDFIRADQIKIGYFWALAYWLVHLYKVYSWLAGEINYLMYAMAKFEIVECWLLKGGKGLSH